MLYKVQKSWKSFHSLNEKDIDEAFYFQLC